MRRWLAVLMVVMAGRVLVGCGDETPIPTMTEEPTREATETPEPTEEPTPTEIPALRMGNKIWNPSFDTYEGGGPLHWELIVRSGPVPSLGPEYHPAHHFGGEYWPPSLRMATEDGGIDASIVQRVTDLQVGALYGVTCWMFAYAGDIGDRGEPSEGDIYLQLGVSPRLDDEILWGPPYANMISVLVADAVNDAYTAYDLFVPYVFAFVALSEEADFYIHAYGPDSYRFNSVFIDNCSMEAVGWDY